MSNFNKSNILTSFLFKLFFVVTASLGASTTVIAACIDNVVLVHGNTGAPDDWDSTYDELLRQGWLPNQIFRPNWGSKTCPGCNNHSGSEETPVRNAINSALANSCTGRIDVIAHSMGVTLAAQQIIKLGQANNVNSFVGIAGAYRGLLTCGVYPFNVPSSTCGSQGLSVSSPFLDWLDGRKIANRVYSMKSWVDQIVCGSGTCLVFGVHASQIDNENNSFTYSFGHFGLQQFTSRDQVNLIR